MKPWLWLPPQIAHDLSPYGLKILSQFSSKNEDLYTWNSVTWKTDYNAEIKFRNPLGLAGGVDKNATSIIDWQNLGCGFLEVGTVTPHPQRANSGKIMSRDLKTHSLWNKMGFPSEGAYQVYENLETLTSKIKIPLLINLGKNRDTPNEKAYLDYQTLMTTFQKKADAFVINISSPNTQGLRDIASTQNLVPFVESLVKHRDNLDIKRPLIIKLSPDLDLSAFHNTLHICLKSGIDGFVLTNTTLSRSQTPFYPPEGGVSGAPLKELSLKLLSQATEICSKEKTKKMIISTGGVMTADNVFERISKGADLVQVYSTLIFEGPYFFRKVADFAKLRSTHHSNTGSSSGT